MGGQTRCVLWHLKCVTSSWWFCGLLHVACLSPEVFHFILVVWWSSMRDACFPGVLRTILLDSLSFSLVPYVLFSQTQMFRCCERVKCMRSWPAMNNYLDHLCFIVHSLGLFEPLFNLDWWACRPEMTTPTTFSRKVYSCIAVGRP